MEPGSEVNNNQFSVINLNANQNETDKKSGEHLNEGFNNDEVDIDYKMNSTNFHRNRPGTTLSVRSTDSTTSRSSVNCSSGVVRCPNLRLTKFFSYKEGGLAKCMEDLKPVISEQIDGAILGSWLLIEINHWDLHSEKVVVLTDKSLVIVSYDFIASKLKDFKRIALTDIRNINYGNLAYPKSSFMGNYLYGAIKIRWGDDPGFLDRWNPFSSTMPFVIFTSHHILYNEKEHETSIYNCDDFIQTLEQAISKLPVLQKVEFKEGPIEIESYASLVSVMYNQNWLGFQLDRNGINF